MANNDKNGRNTATVNTKCVLKLVIQHTMYLLTLTPKTN